MSKGERRKRKKRDDRIEARLEDVLDESRLSKLLTNTIDTIEDNKTQIFEIYQNTRTEVDEMQTRLAELKMEVAETIERVDALTEKERKARLRLTAINAHISEYAGDVIQKAYEEVTQLQVTLGIEREKEQQMRVERDKIEIRLRNLHTMVIRAERMSLAIGSVLSYLSTQVSGVIWKIEAVQKDKFIGARIIKATEEERYRISRELHDGPAQDLANLLFMTSVTERLMEQDIDEAKKTFRELREEIRSCLTSVRQIIFDMRPMALDDLGLPQAVQQLIGLFAQRGKLHATFNLKGEYYPLPKHVEIAVFRIVQEALNNVVHHAQTDQAFVRMHYTPQALTVLIEDMGVGFHVNRLRAGTGEAMDDGQDTADMEALRQRSGRHFGVIGMEERAKIIGAAIQILSSPRKGTKVHLRVQNRMVKDV